jgi:hypothetical protein
VQRGFDLGGFDAEAADLDLVVGAAEVLKQPSGSTGRGRPCGTSGSAGLAVGPGDEALGGERGLAGVAVREADAGHVHLAGGAGRHRAQSGVEQVDLLVREGAADRDGGGPGVLGADAVRGREDHALDGGVAVDHAQSGVLGQQSGDMRGGGGFASGQHLAQGAEYAGVLVDQEVEQGRGGVQGTDSVPRDQVGDQGGFGTLARLQHAAAAVEQRGEQLEEEGVPGHRGALQPGVVRAQRSVGLPRDGRGDGLVGADDALGCAGRAGGEDDAGRVQAGHGCFGIGVGFVGAGGRIEDEGPRAGAVKAVGTVRVGQDDAGSRLSQHAVEARDRELRVEHGERCAELEDRQQGADELRAARRAHGDELAAGHPVAAQVVGQPVGPRVQLSVGHPGVVEHERGRVRSPRRPSLEELVHGGVDRLAPLLALGGVPGLVPRIVLAEKVIDP